MDNNLAWLGKEGIGCGHYLKTKFLLMFNSKQRKYFWIDNDAIHTVISRSTCYYICRMCSAG